MNNDKKTAFEKIEEGLKEALTIARNEAKPARLIPSSETVRGFMCRIDWDHEIGHASDGNRVYPSVSALKEHHTCAWECGIVEVEVRLVRVVEEGTL